MNPRDPAPGGRGRPVQRREGGSVVTYSVAIFMLAALLFYLGVAFFAEEPKELGNGPGEPMGIEEPGAP